MEITVDEFVSRIIMKTTQFQPNTDMFELLAFERELKFTFGGENKRGTFFLTGSSADLKIKPLHSCIDDIDMMYNTRDEVVIPVSFAIPNNSYLKQLSKSVVLYRMMQIDYPGYIHLLVAGRLSWNETSRTYVYVPRECMETLNDQRLQISSHNRLPERGPAIRFDDGYFEASMKGRGVHYNLVFDLVKSMPCPHWPPQADDFVSRRRSHDWPSKSTIDQIVSQGCDVVHASHAYRRDSSDRTQWRLSFSRAETILIHTWTPVQKLIYHMLRYFRRKQFSEDTAIFSYQLKTLMLWNCEQRSADYWKSSCLVRITSDLLSQLVQNIRERRLFNYFIPNCNLMVNKFDLHDSSGQMYDALITKLFPFTHVETLAQWFFENYIVLAAYTYSDSQLNRILSKLVSHSLTERVNDPTLQQEFICIFLSEYEKEEAAKTCVEMDHCITTIFRIASDSDMSLDLCKLILDRLPRIDHRFLEFFRSFVCMKSAYRIDQTGCLPDTETISLVIEVLNVPEKVCFSSFDRYYSESAASYFGQALTLLLIVRESKTDEHLLIELGKAFLFRSLECANASSFFCATSAYLAAIFYQTEEYERTMDFIKLILTKEDHSACEHCTMQPQLLPIIDLVLGSLLSISAQENNVGLAQCSAANAAERSTQNITPETFAYLLLAYIPSSWDQFEELCCYDASTLPNEALLHLPNSSTVNRCDETSSQTFNFTLQSSNGHRTLPYSIQNTREMTRGSSMNSYNSVASDYRAEPLHNKAVCVHISRCSRPRSNEEKIDLNFDRDISEISDGYHQRNAGIKLRQSNLNVSRANQSEVRFFENYSCKTKIYSRKHFRSSDSKSGNSRCSATKLVIYLRTDSAIQILAEDSVNKTFSGNSIKSLVYSRVALMSIDRVQNRIKSNECGEITIASTPKTLQFEMCYSRTERDKMFKLRPTKNLQSHENRNKIIHKNRTKNTEAEAFVKPTRNPCRKFARQHYTLIAEMAASIRRDLMNALMKVSVIHINAFNCALQNDADILTTGFFPHHYKALYHFKCGLFRDALDIFNRVIRVQDRDVFALQSSFTEIIVSPPYWLLLTDDLRSILEEYRNSDECLTIDGRVMALYMKTQCLMTLEQPATEVASTLLHLRSHALREKDNEADSYVKMFSYLYTEVFRRYIGTITEHESSAALSVIENGCTTVIWTEHSDDKIHLRKRMLLEEEVELLGVADTKYTNLFV